MSDILVDSSVNDYTTLDSYNCDGDKLCVIISQNIFENPTLNRKGGNIDCQRFYTLFKLILGYETEVFLNNTHDKLVENLMKVKTKCENVQSKIGLLIVIVLSHGDNDAFLTKEGKDFTREQLMSYFKHDRMKLVPKLFIIQACRGDQNEVGILSIKTDVRGNKEVNETKLTGEANSLVVFSSAKGSVNYRTKSYGSYFSFCVYRVFVEHYRKYDVVTMLTMVNSLMAKKVNITNLNSDIFKQLPTFNSQLSKQLFLPRLSQHSNNSQRNSQRHSLIKISNNENNDATAFNVTQEEIDTCLEEYSTNGLGVCLIFSYYNKRLGADSDVKKLNDLFQNTLNFYVKIKKDLSYDQTFAYLKKDWFQKRFTNCAIIGCLVIVILTHYGEDNKLMIGEKLVTIDELIIPFKGDEFPQLITKPKLFLFQASAEIVGKNSGYSVAPHYSRKSTLSTYRCLPCFSKRAEQCKEKKITTSNSSKQNSLYSFKERQLQYLPSESNILISYSTVPAFDKEGTPFVKWFYEICNHTHLRWDILSILTVINGEISKEISDETSEELLTDRSKLTYFQSRLIKNFFLMRSFMSNNLSSNNSAVQIAVPEIQTDSLKRQCIIFNQSEVQNQCKKINDDDDRLEQFFMKYDFNVLMVKDQSRKDILKTLEEVKEETNRRNNYDCLLIIVLSHMNSPNKIWTSDGELDVDSLIEPFKIENCPSLKDKPKIFIIQACRPDVTNESDYFHEEEINKIENGMMVFYSFTAGNCLNDGIEGSSFVKHLCSSNIGQFEFSDILNNVADVIEENKNEHEEKTYLFNKLTGSFIL